MNVQKETHEENGDGIREEDIRRLDRAQVEAEERHRQYVDEKRRREKEEDAASFGQGNFDIDEVLRRQKKALDEAGHKNRRAIQLKDETERLGIAIETFADLSKSSCIEVVEGLRKAVEATCKEIRNEAKFAGVSNAPRSPLSWVEHWTRGRARL